MVFRNKSKSGSKIICDICLEYERDLSFVPSFPEVKNRKALEDFCVLYDDVNLRTMICESCRSKKISGVDIFKIKNNMVHKLREEMIIAKLENQKWVLTK